MQFLHNIDDILILILAGTVLIGFILYIWYLILNNIKFIYKGTKYLISYSIDEEIRKKAKNDYDKKEKMIRKNIPLEQDELN